MTAALLLSELALALCVWRAFREPEWKGPYRAAMFALWASASAGLVLDGRPDWSGALAPAFLVFAVRSPREALAAALAAACVRLGPHGLVDAAAVLLGAWLAEAVRAQRHRAARLTAWSASLFGFLFVLLPITLYRLWPVAAFAPRPALALAVCGLGLGLGVVAARSLIAGGGTPDPLDPPQRWCTSGLYRFIDHPLQLAEVLVAWSAVLLWPSPLAALGAAVFSLVLVGPVRWYERHHASSSHLRPDAVGVRHHEAGSEA